MFCCRVRVSGIVGLGRIRGRGFSGRMPMLAIFIKIMCVSLSSSFVMLTSLLYIIKCSYNMMRLECIKIVL